MIYSIESQVERLKALEYLADNLHGSLVCEQLGQSAIVHECREIKVIASAGMPDQHDFRQGWGGKASVAMDWLIDEMLAYLQVEQTHMGLIEDPCGVPSDAGLIAAAAGPAWFYRNRVLWPITQEMAKVDLVRQALNWGLSGKMRVVAFCKTPQLMPSFSKTLLVSDALLFELCNSVTCLVTDVFDGEGFMVWKRPARTRPSAVDLQVSEAQFQAH